MTYDPSNPLNQLDEERATVKAAFENPNFQTKAVALEAVKEGPKTEAPELEVDYTCQEKSA